MASTARRYTAEYKANAVDLVINGGKTHAEVARSIGASEMTIGRWVKKARGDKPDPEKQLTETEREELERLRKENSRLRKEAEFAKKVAAWFASDQR